MEKNWTMLVLFFCCFQRVSIGCSRSPEPEKPATQSSQYDESEAILRSFESFGPDPGKLEVDLWYTLRIQNQEAGWSHMTIHRITTPTGVRRRLSSRQELIILRGESKATLTSETISWEDEAGGLLRFHQSETQSGGETIVIDAGKLKDKMITVRGPEIRREAFDPQAREPNWYFRFFENGHPLEQGQVFNMTTYSPQAAGYVQQQIVVKEVLADAPKRITVEQTSPAFPGMNTHLVLDENLFPLELTTLLGGLQIECTRTQDRPNNLNANPGANLQPLLSIPSNVIFSNPRKISKARYRIEGLPERFDAEWLTGPGQRVLAHPSPGTFIIEITPVAKLDSMRFPLQVQDVGLKEWLAPTVFAQSDHPELVSQARAITQKSIQAWSAAKLLRSWVTENIDDDMGIAFASGLEVFRRKKGDCSEKAVLLSTLARAVKIPSRCAIGLVYHDGRFVRHMWTEVWIGRWQPLDAAMGTDVLSAAWIRLGVQSLGLASEKTDGIGGLLALSSNLKITVESYETN